MYAHLCSGAEHVLRKDICLSWSTCFLRQLRLYLSCRYVAFFSLRGIAEWALASGNLIAEGNGPTKEAAHQEALMYQQLGILKGMDKPARWTSGLNWYRYDVINAPNQEDTTVHRSCIVASKSASHTHALFTVHVRWTSDQWSISSQQCCYCMYAYMLIAVLFIFTPHNTAPTQT